METTDRKGTERSAQVWQQGIDSERPVYKADEVFFVNGLMFERKEISPVKTPVVNGRFILMLEDVASDEVSISTAWNLGQTIRSVHAGLIGTAFKKKYGDNHLGKIRLWVAKQQDDRFGKYEVQNYFLPYLIDKRLRDTRTNVLRRFYESLSKGDQELWCEMYPFAVPHVVEDLGFEGDHQRGT